MCKYLKLLLLLGVALLCLPLSVFADIFNGCTAEYSILFQSSDIPLTQGLDADGKLIPGAIYGVTVNTHYQTMAEALEYLRGITPSGCTLQTTTVSNCGCTDRGHTHYTVSSGGGGGGGDVDVTVEMNWDQLLDVLQEVFSNTGIKIQDLEGQINQAVLDLAFTEEETIP